MQMRQVLLLAEMSALLLPGCGTGRYAATTSVPVSTAEAATATPFALVNTPVATLRSLHPPSVYFEPSVLNLTVGETASINVWLDGGRGVQEIALQLTFNPTYLEVLDTDPETDGVQVSPGAFPEPVEVKQNSVVVAEEGTIHYHVAQRAGAGGEGGGIVFSVLLRGVAEGGSPLAIQDIQASDDAGNPLDVVPLSSGLIAISLGDGPAAPTAVPVVEPTAAATEDPAREPTATMVPTAMMAPAATPAPSPAVASTPVPSPPPTGGGIYYVVQAGENLDRIGLRFGTTAAAIASASNLSDPDEVASGTLVLIPVPAPRGGYGYYVQPRDTVYSIAQRIGMTAQELVTLNGIGADYHIEPGQILVVTP